MSPWSCSEIAIYVKKRKIEDQPSTSAQASSAKQVTMSDQPSTSSASQHAAMSDQSSTSSESQQAAMPDQPSTSSESQQAAKPDQPFVPSALQQSAISDQLPASGERNEARYFYIKQCRWIISNTHALDMNCQSCSHWKWKSDTKQSVTMSHLFHIDHCFFMAFDLCLWSK